MRTPYTSLLVHLVWATWDRLPLLVPEIRPRIYRSIQAEAFGMRCEVGAIGGIEDHVHVLVRCSPAVSVSNLVKQTKGTSSRIVQRELLRGEFFKWQGSYGAFSLAETHVGAVRIHPPPGGTPPHGPPERHPRTHLHRRLRTDNTIPAPAPVHGTQPVGAGRHRVFPAANSFARRWAR